MGRYLSSTKHVLFEAARAAGAHRVLKAANDLRGRRVTIVTYHRVADRSGVGMDKSLSSLFVGAETFEKQIRFFKKHYRIVGFEELDSLLRGGDIPSGLMLITFDDGYRDFFQCAYPILRRHNIPATLFIPAGVIGTTRRFPFWWDELFFLLGRLGKGGGRDIGVSAPEEIKTLFAEFKTDMKACFDRILEVCPHEDIERILAVMRSLPGADDGGDGGENAIMTWEQVGEVSDLVGIGSHTLTHRNLRYLERDDIEDEVAGSKREIERRLGRRVLAFSYPNGYYDAGIVEAVRRADYRFAVTTDRGLNDGSGLHLLKRINLWERSSSVVPGRYSEGKLALRVAGL